MYEEYPWDADTVVLHCAPGPRGSLVEKPPAKPTSMAGPAVNAKWGAGEITNCGSISKPKRLVLVVSFCVAQRPLGVLVPP